MTPATSKRRLLALAEFLLCLPQNHFDFGTFGSVAKVAPVGEDALEEAELCGTTACALGWAPALPFAKRLGYKLKVRDLGEYKDAVFTKNDREVSIDKVAKDLFGLKEKAFRHIFFGGKLTSGGTVGDVAAAIRTFVDIRFG